MFALARAAIVDTRLATTGVSADSYWDSRSSFWGTYYSPSRFPTMTWIWENPGFELPLGEDLEFGLQRLLDGVELLVSRSVPPAG